MTSLIRLALACGALFPACAARAADVSVDIVVDFNGAGYNLVRPTADKPAYYLPLSLGYVEVGDPVPLQKPPPPAGEIEHMLAKALFAQGYRLATRESPPSLVFVIRWGYMAPRLNRDSEGMGEIGPSPVEAGHFGAGPTGGSAQMIQEMLARSEMSRPQYAQGYSQQMLSLVAGDTLQDRNIDVLNNRNPRVGQFLEMARSPRYFMTLSAYDYKYYMQRYQDWRQHQTPSERNPKLSGVNPKLMVLWEAHISTELEDHNLEEVLPAMITTAAPWFGHETKTPELITVPAVPAGHVEVGPPQVKLN